MSEAPVIYVVDHDAQSRQLIVGLAEQMGLSLREFSDPLEFLRAVTPEARGCVILELRLCGAAGLQVQEELKRRGSSLPVVFLTAYGDVASAVRAMRQGAFHFLEKPCRDLELWETIQQALDHDRKLRKWREEQESVAQRVKTLSDGECEVLMRILDGMTNREIADDLSLSLRTIELRRSRMMKKLEVRSIAEMAQLALVANGKLAPQFNKIAPTIGK